MSFVPLDFSPHQSGHTVLFGEASSLQFIGRMPVRQMATLDCFQTPVYESHGLPSSKSSAKLYQFSAFPLDNSSTGWDSEQIIAALSDNQLSSASLFRQRGKSTASA
jgi:hypothetical protein